MIPFLCLKTKKTLKNKEDFKKKMKNNIIMYIFKKYIRVGLTLVTTIGTIYFVFYPITIRRKRKIVFSFERFW